MSAPSVGASVAFADPRLTAEQACPVWLPETGAARLHFTAQPAVRQTPIGLESAFPICPMSSTFSSTQPAASTWSCARGQAPCSSSSAERTPSSALLSSVSASVSRQAIGTAARALPPLKAFCPPPDSPHGGPPGWTAQTRRLRDALIALDGYRAGATLRETAIVIYGRERIERDWPDTASGSACAATCTAAGPLRRRLSRPHPLSRCPNSGPCALYLPDAAGIGHTGDTSSGGPLMLEDDDSPFLTIEETAELLRVKRRTLDNLRWSGDGPPARRHGGRIVYHRREVLDWSERRRTRTPAPATPAKRRLRGERCSASAPWRSPAHRRATRSSCGTQVLASRSGFTELVRARAVEGRLAAIRLPDPVRRLAIERGYLGGAGAAHQAGRRRTRRRRMPARGDRDHQRPPGRLGAHCRCLRTRAAALERLPHPGGRPSLRAVGGARQLRQPLLRPHRPGARARRGSTGMDVSLTIPSRYAPGSRPYGSPPPPIAA